MPFQKSAFCREATPNNTFSSAQLGDERSKKKKNTDDVFRCICFKCIKQKQDVSLELLSHAQRTEECTT